MTGDRMQFQAPSILPQQMKPVQVDDGTADFLKTQTGVFLTNANEAHTRQLRQDMDVAKKEGERIGFNAAEKFRPMQSGSLFARQFNESGLHMASEQVSRTTQKKIKELKAKYPANPEGLTTAMSGWKDGFEAELPEEMQPTFGLNYDTIAQAAIDSAAAERKQLNAQAAAARFYDYDREVTNTVEELAPKTFAPGPEGDSARAAMATIRQNYMETLSGNGPEGEYEVAGYKIKSVPGRSGAFSPLEIAKKMTAFDNAVIGNGVYGNFQTEVDAGRGTEAYMNFAKGNMQVTVVDKQGNPQSMKVTDVLTNEEMEEISGKMRTYVGGLNGIEEGEFRKWERGRERYNAAKLTDAYRASIRVETDPKTNEQRIIGGDPVALQGMIADALVDPMVKPETLEKMQKLAADLGTGNIDNPMTTGTTWTGIATGEISDYRSIPTTGISDTTRVKMYQSIDDRNKGQHWSNSNRYKVAADYADAVLAPQKSAGFSFTGDPNSISVANRAEWNKRMIQDILAAEAAGTLPSNPNALPGKDEFDFVKHGQEIADEIAAKQNTPASPELVEIDKEIKAVESQMDNPKPGEDAEAIKTRYRELQDRKNSLQLRSYSIPGGAQK